MTLEHSSVAYFQVIFSTLSMVAIFFKKLLDNIFSNVRLKSILLEINFIKEKAISIGSRVGRLLIEWPLYVKV